MQPVDYDPYAAPALPAPAVPASDTDPVGTLVREIDAIDAELATLRERVTLVEARRKHVIETALPEAIRATDQMATGTTLKDGTTIKLVDKCYVHVNEADRATVYAWLEANGYEKDIQYRYEVIFGRGQLKHALAFRALLSERKIEATGKQYVHPKTMEAALRALRKKVKLPECIRVYTPTVAEITRPKSVATADVFGEG